MAITHVGTNVASQGETGTTLSVTKPGGAAENDVAIAICAMDGTDGITLPTGFTQINNTVIASGGGGGEYITGYKVLTASEPATYDFGKDAAEQGSAAICVFRGVDTVTPLDATSTVNTGNGFNPTCSSITTVTASAALVAMTGNEAGDASPHTPPAGMTEIADESIDNNTTGAAVSVAWEIQVSAGASGTKQFTASETAPWGATLVALRPAATGTTVNVGLATETETAFAVGASKTQAIGLATETDTAFAVSSALLVEVGLATEAETAFAVGASKTQAVGLATETDAAFAVGASKTQAVGLTTETETTFSITPRRTLAIGLAEETDTAFSVQVSGGTVTGTSAMAAQQATGKAYVWHGSVPPQTEELWASSHLSGDCLNPENANGVTDGTFTTNTDNTNWTSRWAMENPVGTITGTQTIKIICRKDAAGGGDPSVLNVDLYENGVEVTASIIGTTVITSATSQEISGTFNASSISNPDDVEILVNTQGVGGPPGDRRSVQIDSINWEAAVEGDVPVFGGSRGEAQQATLSGSGTISNTFKSGSGSLAAQQATASGAGAVTRKGTGAVAAQQATMAGVASLTREATGALAAQQATASGTAVILKEGTGTLTAQQAAISGAAVRTVTGTGALAAQQAAASGAGVRTSNVTGALAAQTATTAGAGTRELKITAVLTAQQAILTGAGGTGATGSGALTAQQATLTGAATRTVTGTAAMVAQQATADGQGSAIPQNKTGEGDLVAQQAIASGAGSIIKTATGALQAATAAADGVGTSGFVADGSLTAQQATLTGAATRTVTGAGTLTAQQATASGAGTRALDTAPALVAQQAVVSGVGKRVLTAQGALSVQAAAASGAGSVIPLTRFADGDLTAAPASLSAQILRTVKGSGTMIADEATVNVYPWVELHTADATWAEQKTDWGNDIG